MSNFTIKLKTPNDEIVEADMLDNYFGHRMYGMRIKGEDKVRRIEMAGITNQVIIVDGMEFKIIKE